MVIIKIKIVMQRKQYKYCQLLQFWRQDKAVLRGKLKGAQCSETVKSRVPSIWFVWKIWDFLVDWGQKLGTRGHRALLEHSPARNFEVKYDFCDFLNFSQGTCRLKCMQTMTIMIICVSVLKFEIEILWSIFFYP